MPIPEEKRENLKPYLSPKIPVKSRLPLTQAQLSRQALEARIKARFEQKRADRADQRRIGHRYPSKP